MASQRDIKIRAILDAAKARRDAKQFAKGLDKIDDSAKKADKGLDRLSTAAKTVGAAFLGSKILDFAGQAVGLGVAAEEAGNKFQAVFGPATQALGDELDALGDKAGIADFELRNITATTGNVIQGLGGTQEQAAELVAELAPAAADLASFNGSIGDAPEVLQAMTSALVGERDSLKNLGIVIKEADVQTQAFAETGKTAASDLTSLEKANATLTLIMEGMAGAAGDLDRNLDTAATQQARLNAEWKEAQAELGQQLLPVLLDLAPVLFDLVEAGEKLVPLIGKMAEDFGDAVGPVADLGGNLAGLVGSLADSADGAEGFGGGLMAVLDGALSLINPVDQVSDAAERANDLFGDGAKASGELEEGLKDAGNEADTARDRFGDMADKLLILEGRTRDEEDAVGDLTDAIEANIAKTEELLDPLVRLQKKQEAAAKAQDALNTAIEEGEVPFDVMRGLALDAAVANNELAAAEHAAKESFYDSADALQTQLAQLGLTKTQIDAIIDSLDLLDGSKATYTIEGKTSGIGLPPGFKWPSIGEFPKLAGGGTIEEPGLAIVGERGPELVSLPGGATVHPNGTAPAATPGNITIPISIGGRVIEEIVIDAQRRITRRGRTI